jgi:hypothetical protein
MLKQTDMWVRHFAITALSILATTIIQPSRAAQAADGTRPMTFLDMRLQRNASAFARRRTP